MKKAAAIILLVGLAAVLAKFILPAVPHGSGPESNCPTNVTQAVLCSIHHDDEFGGAYLDISAEDFNALGFNYGDSIDIEFTTNNAVWKDVGYYNGYYVPAGQELLVAYPGYECIKFCINYGNDIYADNGFDENTRALVTMNTPAKYKDIQDTMSISYSDDINEYTSKEEFANFRMVACGNLKSNILYRGASPVDNSRSRAAVVDSLLQKNGIMFDIDLSDKNVDAPKYQVNEYFQGLMSSNKVVFLGMNAAYKSEEFSAKMKALLESILENDGPYYIHCLEGKDRTGFVCMVIEAMCGATYTELIDDYFATYKNYYGIEKGTTKYEAIKKLHIDEMIKYVCSFGLLRPYSSKAPKMSDLVYGYLIEIGLTKEQISGLREKLSRQ